MHPLIFCVNFREAIVIHQHAVRKVENGGSAHLTVGMDLYYMSQIMAPARQGYSLMAQCPVITSLVANHFS